MTRHRLIALLCVAVALGGGTVATATAVAKDNTAIAVNTKDGSNVFKLAFDVTTVADGVVDQGNAAIAYASCSDCQTVAIAIQIVLVVGDATTVTPQNLALAVNDACDTCATLASAYQFVFGVDGPFRFTKAGWKRMKAIRKALKELSKSDLPIDEIQRRVDALMNDLSAVLHDELDSQEPKEADPDAEPDPSRTPSASPQPMVTPTPTQTATPAATPTPAGTPTATASPGPTPTPTATPTATATADATPTP